VDIQYIIIFLFFLLHRNFFNFLIKKDFHQNHHHHHYKDYHYNHFVIFIIFTLDMNYPDNHLNFNPQRDHYHKVNHNCFINQFLNF